MAGLMFTARSGAVAITANTTKTIATLKAPSTHGLIVNLIEFSGSGNDSAQVPHTVEIGTFVTDGTATGVTPLQTDRQDDDAPSATANKDYSVEPTATGQIVVWQKYVRPNSGDIYPGRLRLKRGEGVFVRIASPNGAANVNWQVTFGAEE